LSYHNCRSCGFMIDPTAASCRFCGHDQTSQAAPSAVGGPFGEAHIQAEIARHTAAPVDTVASDGRDGWFAHFLRFVGVLALVAAGQFLVVGFLWTASILNQTGYRRRDVFLLFVPFIGTVLAVISVWRYTAKGMYWRRRNDRVSRPMSPAMRPTLIGGGWVAIAAFVVVVAVAGSPTPPSQVAAERVAERLSEFAAADSADPAEEFVASDAGFSASFPTPPTRLSEPFEVGERATTLVEYTSETPEAVYSVVSHDLAPVDTLDLDLDLAPESAAASIGGQLEASQRRSIQGHDAVEYVIALPDGIFVKTVTIRAPARVYHVQVAGVTNPPVGYDQFIWSFAIATGAAGA
jgi:hypothetical protein